jgi:hypothetical protein
MATTDSEIWNNGYFLADLTEQPGPMPNSTVEGICAHLTAASKDKVRFDWHPQGGHPMLLYLGDYTLARQVFLAEGDFIRKKSEAYYEQWRLTHDPKGVFTVSNFKSKLATPDSIAQPNMKTIGQFWNGKQS